jgi:hypothetical protein
MKSTMLVMAGLVFLCGCGGAETDKTQPAPADQPNTTRAPDATVDKTQPAPADQPNTTRAPDATVDKSRPAPPVQPPTGPVAAAEAQPKPKSAETSPRNDKPKSELPGANGPLFEYVGKTGPKVSGADVGADVNEPKPDNPPQHRTVPSGTKKVYVAVKFDKKPQFKSLAIDVYNNNGKVEIGSGLALQKDNNATGEYTVTMARNPRAGKFDDGPHQAKVVVDGTVVALVNWGVGGSK